MDDNYASLKKTARRAGFLYLIFTIPGIWGLLYVPKHIMVDGNDTATVHNMLTNELLFRSGIASQFIGYIIYIYLVLLLQKLFKQVNPYRAKLMVAFVLVQVPLAFFLEVMNYTALMTAKGEIMHSLAAAQKQDMVMLFLNIHWYGIIALEVFWGLWLIPFGQLVYRSGFIPKIFGVLLILGGISYVAQSFTWFLFPAYHSTVSHYINFLCPLGEFSITFWLLIMGITKPKSMSQGYQV